MRRISPDWLRTAPVQRVCSMLTSAGFQAWFVGGCVRNTLLDAPVSDLDLATDATPDVVMSLAESAGLTSVPTGIVHGTVTVIAEDIPFEITTFRNDVATDGRRATVAFSTSIEEDAARRDFTMNALYAAPDGRVADPLGGLADLRAGRVRFIGDPRDRIAEDALRVLRFFRFHAWYGNVEEGLDPDGLNACARAVDRLAILSRERVGQEMCKLMAAPDPSRAMASMAQTGVLGAVLPGAGVTTLLPLIHLEEQAAFPADPILRLAALGGEELAVGLRLSKAETRRLALLQSAAGTGETPSVLGYRLGVTDGCAALLLRAAISGQPIENEQFAEARFGAYQSFPVRASDLSSYRGKELGEALRRLETDWIASGFTLSREALLERENHGRSH